MSGTSLRLKTQSNDISRFDAQTTPAGFMPMPFVVQEAVQSSVFPLVTEVPMVIWCYFRQLGHSEGKLD